MVFEELDSLKPSGMSPEQRKTAQQTYAKTRTGNPKTPIHQVAIKREEPHSRLSEIGTNIRVEKVPEYKGSLGEVDDEGCITHADERPILLDSPLSTDDHESRSDLARIIILGEVLGKPKCKK